MIKSMKRLLLLALACIMLGSIGCESIGGTDQDSEASVSETVSFLDITENPLVELPHVEITLGLVAQTYSSESSTTPQFSAQVEDMLSLLNQKANEDGLNTTIKIKWLPSTYTVDMANRGEYGECDAWYVLLNDVLELSEAEYILPLNDLIKKNGPSYYKFLMDHPYIQKGMGIDDFQNKPLFTLPTNRMGTDANVVLMDKQIADKYDLNITNLNDYVEALKTIKAGGEPKYPGLFNIFDFFNEYMGLYGYYSYPSNFLYLKHGDTEPIVYSAPIMGEYKQMLTLLKELYGEQLTGSYRDLYTSISMGETYSIITYPSLFLTTKNTLRKNKEFTLFPLLDSNRMYSTGSGLAINANTQNPDRVMMFIDWMYSNQENMEIWLYGSVLEDGNDYYALDDKGRITYKKPTDPMYDWLFVAGDTIFSMVLARVPHYLPEDYVEIYTQILNDCIPRSDISYPGDSFEKGTDLYEEYQQLLDECDGYYDYLPALLEVMSNPNFDIEKQLKDLEDGGVNDMAQKLTDLFSKK